MKKSKRIPKTDLALYVQLFVRRKKIDHNLQINNLKIQATKSWTRLSKTEKQRIHELRIELSKNYKKKFADYLKEAEPFMIHRNEKRDQELNGQFNNLVEVEEEFTQGEEDSINNETTQSVVPSLDYSIDMQYEEVSSKNIRNCRLHENLKENISEPAPPNVKSAKDLFEIIRDKNEQNDSVWNTLPKTEKRKYQNAVLSLKKKYIDNYVKYLESLESRELFQHYTNKL